MLGNHIYELQFHICLLSTRALQKNQKAQYVQRENGCISILLIFVLRDLYVNLIPFCTRLTYNVYNYSAGVGQLKNMCAAIMKSAY